MLIISYEKALAYCKIVGCTGLTRSGRQFYATDKRGREFEITADLCESVSV